MADWLRCTAFEELMLSQDSPAYPCVIYCRMQLAGKLDREPFAVAARAMLDRHPLLRSRIVLRRGRAHWQPEEMPTTDFLHWTDKVPDHIWWQDGYVDLRARTGLAILVHDLPDRCVVVFQCHHACADGLGLLAAAHDLWLVYDALQTGQEPRLPKLAPDALPHRNRFGLTPRRILQLLPKQAVGLLGVRQYLMRQPAPILPHQPTHVPQRLGVVAHTRKLDAGSTRALRAAAQVAGVTLNDLLAAAVLRAVAEFRAARAVQQGRDWLRMMVPVNMRSSAADYQQTACNIVSSVFLDRPPGQVGDRGALLRGVHQEMELIKRNRLAFLFNFSLWVRSRCQRGDRVQRPPRRCQTSVVFTNLGKVYGKSPLGAARQQLKPGGLVLEQVEALAPLTPWMGVAFTATLYAEELYLIVRYDQRVLSRADSEELLQRAITETLAFQEAGESVNDPPSAADAAQAGAGKAGGR
jgi:NRPS condensation-like uncharacterized protein